MDDARASSRLDAQFWQILRFAGGERLRAGVVRKKKSHQWRGKCVWRGRGPTLLCGWGARLIAARLWDGVLSRTLTCTINEAKIPSKNLLGNRGPEEKGLGLYSPSRALISRLDLSADNKAF